MDNLPTAQPQQIQPQEYGPGNPHPKIWLKKKSKRKPKTKKIGRPGKFGQIKIPQLRKILELGATDEQIAKFFGLNYGTFKSYKHDNPEFAASLKEWKRQADERVVDSLFHRALGYEHPSEEIHIVKNKVVRVQTRKIYPPDTTAQIFWLKNRQPGQWRDKHEFNGKGDTHIHLTTINVKEINTDDLTKLLLGRMNGSVPAKS